MIRVSGSILLLSARIDARRATTGDTEAQVNIAASDEQIPLLANGARSTNSFSSKRSASRPRFPFKRGMMSNRNSSSHSRNRIC